MLLVYSQLPLCILYKKIALLEERGWKRVHVGLEYVDINGHKNVYNNSVIDYYRLLLLCTDCYYYLVQVATVFFQINLQ